MDTSRGSVRRHCEAGHEVVESAPVEDGHVIIQIRYGEHCTCGKPWKYEARLDGEPTTSFRAMTMVAPREPAK